MSTSGVSPRAALLIAHLPHVVAEVAERGRALLAERAAVRRVVAVGGGSAEAAASVGVLARFVGRLSFINP